MPKIVMLGSGSLMFCETLMLDILATEPPEASEIRLIDRTKPKLVKMESFVKRVLKENNLPVRLIPTLDRRKALKGADYVIVMFECDGGDAVKLDREIPLVYGVDQCVGDSLGPNDNAVLPADIRADMKELCPDAILLRESNPKVFKPHRKFKKDSPAYRAKRRAGYRAIFGDCLRFLAGGYPTEQRPAPPFAPHDVSDRFFGMNVAPSPDPAGDAIQVQALRDLRAGAVRIDYGTHADRAPTDRFIGNLLAAGFALTLHTVQDPDQASTMDSAPAQQEWREFLDVALELYGGRIEALEVGSTPNRNSWSGYTPMDYSIAARIAREAVAAWAVRHPAALRPILLGPNISDFAPYYTIGQLASCRREGVRFDVMTDNLFVDRAGEPEQFDPSILGRVMAGILRMDQVGKQRVLASLAAHFGTNRSWCTYIHYTLNFGRIRERKVSEDQYINYMLRSHIQTAAAGCFERCYWGTLVSHFKGLIDESIRVTPYPPDVHHRFATLCDSGLWKRREQFIVPYAAMAGLLAGARFVRRWPLPEHVRALEFRTTDGTVVAAWTRDGQSHLLDLARSPLARPADRILDREGNVGGGASEITLSESPVYLRFAD